MSQEHQESLSQALWKYRIYFNVVTSPSSHLRTSCLLNPKVTNFFQPPKCQTKTSHHTEEITSRLHNRKWHSCWHTNLWFSAVLRIKSDICKTWHPFVNIFSAILPFCVLCEKIISSKKKGPSLFFSFYFYYYFSFFFFFYFPLHEVGVSVHSVGSAFITFTSGCEFWRGLHSVRSSVDLNISNGNVCAFLYKCIWATLDTLLLTYSSLQWMG